MTALPADRKDLINAKALQSLRDEMQLQAVLGRSAWMAVHSHHFFDLKHSVWRELDALASRTWRGTLRDRPILLKVLLIVESKRIAEKHILLPRFEPLKQAIIYDWLGSQRRTQDRFSVYQQAGLDQRLAQRVDTAVSGGAFDIMPNAPNILFPPDNVEWHAASFTEAHNGQGKVDEAGSSVVWKTRLDLQSAGQALAQAEVDFGKQELLLALQFARLKQIGANKPDFDLFQEIISQVRERTFTITVLHPIIVVDADLWGVTQGDAVPIQHARIHLTGVSRFPYYWFDLVRREAIERVLSEAQEGYDVQTAEKGLTPEEVNMGIAKYDIAAP